MKKIFLTGSSTRKRILKWYIKKLQKEKNSGRHNEIKANKKTSNDVKVEKKFSKSLEQPIQDHFVTFQLKIELFTLLFTTIQFKWIQTDRVRIKI
jgi:hypothetical protein